MPEETMEGHAVLSLAVQVIITRHLVGMASAIADELWRRGYGPDMVQDHWHFEVACGPERFCVDFRPWEEPCRLPAA